MARRSSRQVASHALLGLVTAAGLGAGAGWGCGLGGGGCKYEPYEGYCTLGPITATPNDGGSVTVATRYSSESAGMGEGAVEYTVPAAEEAAARAHLESHKRVPCTGDIRTTGSCSPGRMTLTLPAFSP